MIIEPGKKYLVDSAKLREKYGRDPIITIENLWNKVGMGRGGAQSTLQSDARDGKIGAIWTAFRMGSDGLDSKLNDNENIWYGHINGLGEGVHTSELKEIT